MRNPPEVTVSALSDSGQQLLADGPGRAVLERLAFVTTMEADIMTAGASTWSSAPAAEGKADRTASVSGAAARGPVWVNTNWLVWRGLRQHGRTSLAREVEESVIRLVERSGFREYFDPFDGEGYGSPDFSWTAALLIDMLQSRSRSIGGVS